MHNETLSSLFIRHIRKRFSFIIGHKVLLAVSGGLDSMAMLHLFLEAQKKLEITPIVAHIDHNLRSDSGRDAQFVDNFCQEHGVQCYLSEINKGFWSDKKGNVEDRARRERYRILEQLARKCRIPHIATAHHRNDQVETVLMRILDRGTGLHGLGGIAEMSARGKLKYIRPLLPFLRERLVSFMAGREWVEDETNTDTAIRRNFFRHEVIPYLERMIAPAAGDHLAQLADTARYYDEILAVSLGHFWATHRRSPRSSYYIVDKGELAAHPDHFWAAAIAHLIRTRRRYGFGSRTVQDIIGFLRKPDSLQCRYLPLTIQKKEFFIEFRLLSQ